MPSRGPSVKTLALLFAGLTAAKPLYREAYLVPRQSVPAAPISAAVVTSAAPVVEAAVVASVPPPVDPAAVTTTDAAVVAAASSSVDVPPEDPATVTTTDAPVVAAASSPVDVPPTSAAAITTTPSITPSASGAPLFTGEAKAIAGNVIAMVSGTQRTCSVQSVTAMTTTSILTMPDTTIPIYTITQKPTLGCTCDDGWMAGIATSMGSDGLGTVTCQFGDESNPAIGTQTSAMVPDPTYVNEWCQTLDANDPDKLVDLWENKNVAGVLDKWTNGKGDGWLQAFVEHALPNGADVDIGGCGVPGGSCLPTLDCKAMTEQGMGAHYWILMAVKGFHDKINVAHEFLQDTAIDNILSLDKIASDFSAPQSTGMNSLSVIASLLSAGIFLAGSVTGVVGVVASEIGIAASAAKAAAEAASRAALAGNRVAQVNKLDGIANAAGKTLSNAGGTTRATNALGAGLWTTASSFTMISAFSDEEGQVEASDLVQPLHDMFSAARTQIEALGNLAMGRGGDYSALPTAPGSGNGPVLAPESYIAGFFSDGKFLLSESNPTYKTSIQDSYGTFKSKLVDQALQTAGYQVFALTDLDNEEECHDESLWGGYGAQWMDPLGDGNFKCMQLYRDNHDGGCGALTTCDWVVAEQTVFDKLQNDYGFNMVNYYTAAAQCNKAQLADRMPDYTAMQADGVTPACYYNINSQQAKKFNNCHGKDGLLCDSGFTLSNF